MTDSNLMRAVAYYEALGEKDVLHMAEYLSSDVQYIGPMAELEGKESVLEATEKMCSLFNTLTIRSKFSSENQAMLAYDLDCPAPVGKFRVAALMSFNEGLISKIELFYDSLPFQRK